jgi:small conductance mechanosensitive channel
MSRRFMFASVFAAALAGFVPTGIAAPAPAADPLRAAIDGLRASAAIRDSLTALADSATGASRDFLEELVWRRHLDAQADVMEIAAGLHARMERGNEDAASRQLVVATLHEQWPRYVSQLERRRRAMAALGKASDAASGAQRLEIESDMTRLSDRIVDSYRGLVDAVLALERDGIDMSEQRTFLTQGLRESAMGLTTRIQLVTRDRAAAAAVLSRSAGNIDLRYALDAAEERLKRATLGLSTAIDLMDRLDLEDTDLRVGLILATGRVTTDVFRWPVLWGLLRAWGSRLVEFVAGKLPQWLFQLLLVVLTFLGFRWAATLVRRLARRAVRHSRLSALMQSTLVRLTGYGIMTVGIVVILTQLGVQVAPLLAGLGIAGFAVGFAMQNALSNFAAGGMILGNRPFDIGDEIEVAGVTGIVRRMSLVSTTILTADNQTLIVPNSTVWSGVIRNRTAEPIRRVDLTVAVGYAEDVERIERVLREIVDADEKVLHEPAALIKVSQLAESSVNFLVRVWTRKDLTWDVTWDLTRAIKIRFDQERISFPFPQQELHVNPGRSSGGAIPVETKPGRP